MLYTKKRAPVITVFLAAAFLSASLGAAAEDSKKPLPELKAKQALDNIRFISHDGKYTYYQRRSGDLQLSTNYSNEQVLEGEKLSEFLVYSSPARKKLLVVKDGSFHSDMSPHKKLEIYLVPYGGAKSSLLGSGRYPKLHQGDAFASYYLPREKKLQILDLRTQKKPFSVQLLNPVNPFFSPQVFMPTPNDVVHSDINEKGHEAFLLRSLLDGKTSTVYKSSYPGNKLEACLMGEALFIGEFERDQGKGGTKILKVPLYGNKDFANFEILYQSASADIGNMVCLEDEVYFIKTVSYKEELNLKETEVASLNLKNKKVSALTNLKRVTQLINMDGMVLAPYLGRYYIVKGSASIVDDSIQKEKQ